MNVTNVPSGVIHHEWRIAMHVPYRTIVRPLLVSIVAGLIWSSLPVWSQNKEPDTNQQAAREKLQAGEKQFVSQNLELTESEAKAFWPVYDSYHKTLTKLGDRMIALIDSYIKLSDTMTDQAAAKLVTDFLAIERERLTLRETYLPKFRKVLPMKKVARYYQLENKMMAIVHYEAASRIPLLQ